MGELSGQSERDRLVALRRLRDDRDQARQREHAYFDKGRPLAQQLGQAQAALAVRAFEALRAGVPATTVLEASGFEDERYDRAGAIGQGIAAYLRFTYPNVFELGAGNG